MANNTYKPLLIDSIKTTVDLPKQRFVGFDGNICGAGAKALGVSDVEIEAGQYAPVGIIGIFLVEAGGTITVGQAITSDEEGKAVAVTSTEVCNGYALDNASTCEIIRIVRGI